MYHHRLVDLDHVVKELVGLRNQERQHLIERQDAGHGEDETDRGDLELRFSSTLGDWD